MKVDIFSILSFQLPTYLFMSQYYSQVVSELFLQTINWWIQEHTAQRIYIYLASFCLFHYISNISLYIFADIWIGIKYKIWIGIWQNHRIRNKKETFINLTFLNLHQRKEYSGEKENSGIFNYVRHVYNNNSNVPFDMPVVI